MLFENKEILKITFSYVYIKNILNATPVSLIYILTQVLAENPEYI